MLLATSKFVYLFIEIEEGLSEIAEWLKKEPEVILEKTGAEHEKVIMLDRVSFSENCPIAVKARRGKKVARWLLPT